MTSNKTKNKNIRYTAGAGVSYRHGMLLYMYLTFLTVHLSAQQQIDTSLWNIDLDDVVVTAQYAPTTAEEAVHQVTVLKAEDLQRSGFVNLAEALSQQINLRVDTDPILGNGLLIQGIGGENVQIMIDGVPVIGRVDGNVDLSQISLSNVARIEIVQGAMSAQYGSNAAGGVINIITKRSQIGKWQIDTRHQLESLGIMTNNLSVGKRSGKFWGQVSVDHYRAQFAPEDSLRLYETVTSVGGESYQRKKTPWNPKRQLGLGAQLRYDLSDSTNLRYRFGRFHEELSIYGEIRRPQFQPYAFDDEYTTFRQDHNLHLESWLRPGLYLQSTTAFNDYERLGTTRRLDMTVDTTSLVPGTQDTTAFTSFLHRTILSTSGDRFWNVLTGLEITYETGSGDRINDEGSNLTRRGNYALWAGLRLRPGDGLTVETNLRYGYNTKYDHPLIPSVNLAWQPTKAWTIRAGYAHGFRAPSLKELHFNFVDVNHYIVGNPELEAEHARNATFSVAYRKKSGSGQLLAWNANFFYNSITNRIILAEYESLRYHYQNLEKYQTHGLNLQLAYTFQNRLSFSTNFAYTRLYNDLSEDTDSDSFTPLSEMQNELQYQLPLIDTDLKVIHRFVGKQVQFYQDSNGVLQQGSVGRYHLLHLNLSRAFWQDRILWSAGVKNLLDQSTVPLQGGNSGGAHSSSGADQLIGFGRSFFVSLQLSLGW